MSETKESGGCEFQGQCEQDKDGPRADYCPLEKVVFDQTAMIKRLVEGLEDIRNLSTPVCHRCEGEGRLWADHRCHTQEEGEKVGTIACPPCDGTGKMYPDFDELKQIVETLISAAEKLLEDSR